MNISDRQHQILRLIHQQTVERGYPPSIRDLGRSLNFRSTNGVREHLMALVQKGLIEKKRYVARSLRLTCEGEESIGLSEPKDELELAAKLALVALEGVLKGSGQFRFIEARTAVDALRLAGVQ